MSDIRVIAASLRLAHGCIRDARALHAEGSRNAAYLAQQGAEQIVRALATSESIHIERHDAHQLDKTTRRFPAENSALAELRSIVWLEAYATAFRYPTGTGRIPASPDHARLSAAIAAMDGLLLRAAGHFGVVLDDLDEPAGTSAPMRG